LKKNQAFVLVLVCGLLVFAPLQLVKSDTSVAVTVTPAQNSVQVGDQLTVNVTVSNVENLYGLDVTVNWNSSMLQLTDAAPQLGVESRPSGVLHETNDSPIIVAVDDSTSQVGEYHLVATSQADAASFNGSGTIVTLTFNVTQIGHSSLTVQSSLADHPQPTEATSELIDHSDVGASVDAAAIPEFPQTAAVLLLVGLVTVTFVFAGKRLKKKQ
jgi:hypothetical protein